jgi:prepilin-type N-terminal cleavage/methylation domain-containing protein
MFGRSRSSGADGFTLVELLVTMLIIGILAAIALPVFLSQRQKAHDSAVKADMSTLGDEVSTYYVDNVASPTLAKAGGRYLLAGNDIGPASANVVLGAVDLVDGTHWCVDATNPQGRVETFKYSAKGGLAPGSCAATDLS